MKHEYSFVDLFSGAGGMSYGFKANPSFIPCFAVDAQIGKPSTGKGKLECNSTYEANIGIKAKEADLTVYSPQQLLEESGLSPKSLDVLISCAPCTGFSRMLGKNHIEDDPRNNLVERTGAFVEVLQPKILVMENARELVMGRFSYHLRNLESHLSALGYSMKAEIHMLNSFGLPQIRQRSIVIAVRDHGKIRTLPELWEGYACSANAITVRSAIGNLPVIKSGITHPDDPMHVSPKLTGITLERIEAIPPDGGSWIDLISNTEVDRLLIPSMKRSIEKKEFGSFPDVYGRLWWEKPCVTIKRECAHVGNGRYAHPEQHRLCTVREMGLMNGFPTDYVFNGSLSNKYRHIGDAVPPIISFQISKLCQWMLTGEKPSIFDCILPNTTLDQRDIVSQPIGELFSNLN